MTRTAWMFAALAAFRAGRFGDGAAYKAAASGVRATPAVAAAIARLDSPIPSLDMARLRALAPGTLGHGYAAFIDRHGFRPLAVSERARADLAGADPLAIRYAILHDAFHVLLGYDAGLPGELGVWTFVAEQDYAPAFRRAARAARLFYPLAAPRQRAALAWAAAEARRMAAGAACIIAAPLEQYWDQPLDAVRARLGVNPPFRPR